jgi:signal transduction histidine kinase/CheY-like chemotaxis protein
MPDSSLSPIASTADDDWPGLLCSLHQQAGQAGWQLAWASAALKRLCGTNELAALAGTAPLKGLADAIDRQAGSHEPIDIRYAIESVPPRWLHARGQWHAGPDRWQLRCTLDDVTPQHEAKAELMHQRRLLDGLTRHLPGALLVMDIPEPPDDVRVLYASDGLQEVYEVTLEQVRDHPLQLLQRIHPEDRDRLVRDCKETMQQLGDCRTEFRVSLPQRGFRWLASQRRMLHRPGGAVSYEVLTDITERKQIEHLLIERDRLLHSLGRHVPGMTFRLRGKPSGPDRFDYISDGVRELFECEPEQCLQDWTCLLQRVHPDDLPGLQRRLAHGSGAAGGVTTVEYRAQLPQRGLRWHSVHASIETNPDGSIDWYGHVADTTHQKLYDEAKVAAEAAERASRHKSEFLSRMSHELRTPLNAVLGFSQLLRMDRSDALSPGQREKVDLIEQAGTHLLAVIGDVLDLAQIEAGSMPVSLQSLAVSSVLGEALALVSPLAAKTGVHLATPLLPAQTHLLGDALRLRQVLVNLLSNAIKYNRAGGEVCVRAWCDREQVAIEVADTGRGLTPEQCAHLFEPFNRLGAERGGIEGTGIGLVIVQRLLGLMNGSVSVRSDDGGSRFCIRLPAAPSSPISTTASATLKPQGRQTAELLYVEDNEVNVLLLQQIVSLRPDWRLRVARSGQEALQAMQHKLPDLLLLDMHLGDMSGFELAALLDRDTTTAAVPRIALSADAMPGQVKAAKLQGFVAYLTKPVDVPRVLACLDDQLARHAGR